MFGKHTLRTVSGTNVFQNQSRTYVAFKMTLHSSNNAMNCTLVLIEEKDGWKIEKLTVP
jgi:hypothetical protein